MQILTKLLYANGCSWTEGNGIPEDPLYDKKRRVTDYVWPAHIARRLGYEYVNDALGAGSNSRILRTTTDFVRSLPKEKHKDLVVVLGWTTNERDEIYLEENGIGEWFHYNAAQQFSTTHTIGTRLRLQEDKIKKIDKYQRDYIENVYSPTANMLKYIQQIYLLTNLLENLGIKYFSVASLPPAWDTELNDQYRNQIVGLDIVEDSFSSFCTKNKLQLSSCIHPMVIAHARWGNFIYEKLVHKYGLSNF